MAGIIGTNVREKVKENNSREIRLAKMKQRQQCPSQLKEKIGIESEIKRTRMTLRPSKLLVMSGTERTSVA